jgi:hypothetical protein
MAPGDCGHRVQAALENLATALDPRAFATTLTISDGRPPRLTLINRHSLLSQDVYADAQLFWWPGAVPIGVVSDPLAAARTITSALRPSQGSADG